MANVTAAGTSLIPGLNMNFNFVGVITQVWGVLKWLLVIFLLFVAIYYFFVRTLRYKDIIEIWDTTGGGIVTYQDKGYWKVQKPELTGYYTLLKNKHAQLKNPGTENAILTKKSKYKFTFLKFGDGAFDFAVIPPTLAKGDLPKPIPMADEDWAKHSIKKAAEKNKLGGWWNENKGFVITATAMVLAVVLMMSVIPAARDAATNIAASNEKSVGAMQSIADQLERVADGLGASTGNGGAIENPPPGI